MPGPVGPGPGAYMLPPTVGYEHHDISRYRNPQYTMRPRYPQVGKAAGPPPYNVGNMTNIGKPFSPAYTIAPRVRELRGYSTPGPGTYTIGKMETPRPPAYSISPKVPALRPYNTPGPNQYVVPSTLGRIAYSIAGKHDIMGKERSPGPAKYGGTPTDIYKNKRPMYSIAGLHPMRGGPQSPGPAAYFPKLQGPCSCGVSFGLRTDKTPYITAEDHMPCID